MLCIKLVNYWDKYTEFHGQQYVKKYQTLLTSQERSGFRELQPLTCHLVQFFFYYYFSLSRTRALRKFAKEIFDLVVLNFNLWVYVYLSSPSGVTQLGGEASSWPPSSAYVKNEWSHTSVPPLSFHITHRHNFNFYECSHTTTKLL